MIRLGTERVTSGTRPLTPLADSNRSDGIIPIGLGTRRRSTPDSGHPPHSVFLGGGDLRSPAVGWVRF